MNILIIGGTGILSTSVVNECIQQGHSVTMLNRGRRKEFINPKATLIKCDVYNEQEVRSKLDGKFFDVVIDFLIKKLPELKYSLSLFGKKGKQYIFISSAQAYNTSVKGILTEESELCQHLWSYSINKVKCEQYLKDYCTKNKINYTIIRPGVNYDNQRIPYGIYPPIDKHWTIAGRILAGKPMITWNNGLNRLNLTRTEDFAKGTCGLLGKEEAYNEAFNVVGDYIYSWKEVLETLGEILGVKVKTVDIPVDFYASELIGDDKEALLGGRSQDLCCSNEKLKKVFPEFKTQFNLKEGLLKTIKFYKENNYYHGIDYGWDGDTDRIINKFYSSINKDKDKNLHFISYMNCDRATEINNKKKYNNAFKKDTLLFKIKSFFKYYLYSVPKYLIGRISNSKKS